MRSYRAQRIQSLEKLILVGKTNPNLKLKITGCEKCHQNLRTKFFGELYPSVGSRRTFS